jgi:hypothetical protein
MGCLDVSGCPEMYHKNNLLATENLCLRAEMKEASGPSGRLFFSLELTTQSVQ